MHRRLLEADKDTYHAGVRKNCGKTEGGDDDSGREEEGKFDTGAGT